MDKRIVWVIVAIVVLALISCCCLVVFTGGLSAFILSTDQTDAYEIETMDVNETEPETLPNDPFESEPVKPAEEPAPEFETETGNGLTGDILAQMDQIETDVNSFRDLPPAKITDRKTLTSEELNDRVLNDFFEDYDEREVFLDLVELDALGLIQRDYDLYGLYIDLYSEQIAGFYDDETTEMVVVAGEGFDGNARMTYAHEYVHAMQDAAFDLDDGLGFNEDNCEIDNEYCAALQALVEGDATLSEIIWFQQFGTEQDQKDIMDFYETYESPVYDNAPEFLKEDFVFPYNNGFEFVQVLFEQGGYSAINDAFKNPPVSTEQILHPAMYPNEVPVMVDLPYLNRILGDDWEDLGESTLGEWGWRLLLSRPYEQSWALNDADAAEAAQGWGGDRYTVYYNETDDETILVSLLVMDSQEESTAFWKEFNTYGQNRWGEPTTALQNSTKWELGDQIIYLEKDRDLITWVISPDADLLDLVLSEINDF